MSESTEGQSSDNADPVPASNEPSKWEQPFTCLGCLGTVAVMVGVFWLTLDRTGSIWKATAVGALAPLGAAMAVAMVAGTVIAVLETNGKERRDTLTGLVMLPVLVVLVLAAWDAGSSSDATEGDDRRCADITDRWNDGAGTFSNGNATDDEVQWAINNGCPGW